MTEASRSATQRQLELVSSTAFGNGILELAYRPHR
jgi:hypothetical protein